MASSERKVSLDKRGKKKTAFSIRQNGVRGRRRSEERACSDAAGCVTAAAFTETAQTKTMLCAHLKTHGVARVCRSRRRRRVTSLSSHFPVSLLPPDTPNALCFRCSAVESVSLCHEVILFPSLRLWKRFVVVGNEVSRHQVCRERAKNCTSSSGRRRMAPK